MPVRARVRQHLAIAVSQRTTVADALPDTFAPDGPLTVARSSCLDDAQPPDARRERSERRRYAPSGRLVRVERPPASSCLCGCVEAPSGTTARYRPGHDARHAALVGRRLLERGGIDQAALAELPTDALRSKALAMLQRGPARTAPPRTTPIVQGTPATPSETGRDERTTVQLLAGYASTLAELRHRGVIRSNNAPAGDYGEWLVAKALDAKIVANAAMKSYDLTTADGRRVQVMALI